MADRTPLEIDALDRQIIERLRRDGREGNRSLATALGVSEPTIAARIKRLEQGDAMRVVALTDMFGFGHSHLLFGFVEPDAPDVVAVSAALAALPDTNSVAICSGTWPIVVTALARDDAHLDELLSSTLTSIPGVKRVQAELALDVPLYGFPWAILGGSPPTVVLPPGAVDDLDRRLIEQLQLNGRRSNRQLARELEVSEGTVRSRIGRLQDEGMIRIHAVSDVATFGLGAFAFVGVNVASGAHAQVASRLMARDDVPTLARTIGVFDFVAVMTSSDHQSLGHAVLHEISRIDGIVDLDVLEGWENPKHTYLWAVLH